MAPDYRSPPRVTELHSGTIDLTDSKPRLLIVVWLKALASKARGASPPLALLSAAK
jgi:hypothetical protein